MPQGTRRGEPQLLHCFFQNMVRQRDRKHQHVLIGQDEAHLNAPRGKRPRGDEVGHITQVMHVSPAQVRQEDFTVNSIGQLHDLSEDKKPVAGHKERFGQQLPHGRGLRVEQ